MSTSAPVGLDSSFVADGVSFAAYVGLGVSAAAGEGAIPAPDHKSEDVDGCDVAVEKATLDEELPLAEGGVA